MIDPNYATEAELAIITLIKRRTKLALMTDIPDMAQYVQDWITLSQQFEAVGLKHNAAMCKSNAARYAGVREVETTPKQHEVVVRIDGGQTVKFENVDDMADWLADAMQTPVEVTVPVDQEQVR